MARSSPMQSSTSIADLLLLTVEAEEMRRSLKQFVVGAWKYVDPAPYVDGWCVDAICEHLTALTSGQIRFLLINIPPRHSKSTICSVLWPVWGWLQNPAERFLSASYSLDLATRDNLKKRNLIDSQWFQERYVQDFRLATDNQSMMFTRERDFGLSQEQNAKRFFMNDKLGYQMATSVASSATGHGGSILIIDDAHAADEAHGSADRDAATRWFRETWSNRMNDANKDKMMVIGQRIHEEDVSGIILSERPDWVHLNLPAEFEPARKCFTSIGWQDPRTQEGELLWPERFAKETLERYKRDLGSIGFSAQYQQSPVPSTGGTFQDAWKRYFEIDGEHYILHTKYGRRKPVPIRSCRNEAVCDLAVSEKEKADFFVIQVWAITPENECLLLHQVRGHFNNPDQQKRAIETYERYALVKFHVEKVAYQLAYIQQLRNYEIKEEIEPNVYKVVKVVSIPVVPWTPFRDKEVRASVAAVKMEAGDMYWLANAPYLQELEPEIFLFPKSKKKDQVDCHSMIADILSSPHGPAMWSVDSDEPVSVSPERAPSSGKPIPSIYEDKGIIEVDEEELEEWG
jgi:predicted phage terminase large subunit-like protein